MQKQTKFLKDIFKKCLGTHTNMTKFATTPFPKCNYFNQTLFLVEMTGNHPAKSNVEHVVRIQSELTPISRQTAEVNNVCQPPTPKQPPTKQIKLAVSKNLSESNLEKSNAVLFSESLVLQLESLPEKKLG